MKNILSIVFLFYFSISFSQITLTHNVGNTPIVTGMQNCDYDEHWARAFTLSDFGITTSEQFIIRSGQVAISNSYDGARVQFHLFAIDSDFPNSSLVPIGGGATVVSEIGNSPEIIDVDFVSPIVVPSGVERILVVVSQSEDVYNPDYKDFIIAGTEKGNDVSWFSGCREYYTYTPTTELNTPILDANFFINVTGDTFSTSSFGSNTTLSHNICDDVIKTVNFSCYSSYTYFARDFYLKDFGISNNEEFIINSGQVGISYGSWGATVEFNIYKIDDNFPDSFSEDDLIGKSQEYQFPYRGDELRIINLDFDVPIVVPEGVERILVEVRKGVAYGSALAHIAGTAQDDGASSWYKGCLAESGYINTDDFVYYPLWPGKDYNLFINVTGNVNHVTNNFEMNISNICSEFLKEFSVENKDNIASVVWNFGDPASGTNNTSTDLSPFHDFTTDGTYTITATVTGNDASVEVLTETIDVKEPPNAYGIDNIESCEDNFGTGLSSSFDTSNVHSQVLGNQTGRVVTYIDGVGNEYDVLPNPFTNNIKDRETITVRVARQEELCCYSEISFDLIVNPMPDVRDLSDLNECDDDNDGLTSFNLTQIQSDLSGNNNLVDFYFENGQQIFNSQLNAVINKVQFEEIITVKITNTNTNCYNETTFKLIVNPLPIANPLTGIIGCDDNNDGISEYFDVSNVESDVLNGQLGMEVSYHNSNGNSLSKPLPNPYTNSFPNQEVITVRVTNTETNCFAETNLTLNTSNKPQINTPQDIYVCDEGSGYGSFDLSNIESTIISNQSNLNVYFFDSNGSDITSSISSNFKNTEAWNQTINVKVENASSSLCVSETSFNLVVNELPLVLLENEYFLCNLEPSMSLSVDSKFDNYEWSFEDGTVISNSHEVILVDAGDYSLKISEIKNGIICENVYNFKMIRSVLPKIVDIEYQELSDSNYIEISASGDGDFQYSIDGNIYQNSNRFNDLLGGIYTVYVRDKLGCGEDTKEITVLDYPKYFTPNGDGINDTWQIKGIKSFPNAIIFIYDRYGKLLKQINSKIIGWDGTFNGERLTSSDYWFTVDLDGTRTFNGHFSLKR